MNPNPRQRRIYTTPVLREHGTVAELTLAASDAGGPSLDGVGYSGADSSPTS